MEPTQTENNERILKQIRFLNEELNKFDKTIEDLVARLAPVTSQEPDKHPITSSEVAVFGSSPIYQSVREISARISHNREKIERCISQLEI